MAAEQKKVSASRQAASSVGHRSSQRREAAPSKDERRTTSIEVRSDLCRSFSISPEQAVLDLFKQALSSSFEREDFATQLSHIKQLFVQRDYDGIFLNPSHLPVYVCEYVPSRVLCYLDLFLAHPELLSVIQKPELRVTAIGGGAGSDVMAIFAARALIECTANQSLLVNTHDMGAWGEVLSQLQTTAQDVWKLSSNVVCSFHQHNVLNMTDRASMEAELKQATLVTVLFTINELFHHNKADALALVRLLLDNLPSGAHVLIVDSAGDFSHLQVGSKTFMVFTLLDGVKGWSKVLAHDSRWYRFPSHLQYPLQLNNIRHFCRLYQVL